MEQFLREWRQSALNKHQHEAAVFIGDKLYALSNNDQDAFWLAQVHFSTGNYSQAQAFLSQELVVRNASCKYLAGHCKIKQGKYDEALAILGEKSPQHLIPARAGRRRKLQHVEHAARNGVGGRGERGPAGGATADRWDGPNGGDDDEVNETRYEAGMCHLRGLCYAKQNAFDRAKECYKDAVRIDVQCFEAFEQLMKNALMSPDEEWKLLESLDFEGMRGGEAGAAGAAGAGAAADFVRMLYTTRVSKYEHADEFSEAVESLSTHYGLAANADMLIAKADLLFTQCRFREALQLTSAVLAAERHNFAALPVHVACLHELNERNALFLLAHRLADEQPEQPAAWLAVAVYYLTIGRVTEARRYFSKASMMDPLFGPAWIGFAHTFAAEGEHDQAISAYSTAARLFQGTHLPPLFLGMQNLQLHNVGLAREYLDAARRLCRADPLLLNELGVVAYHEDRLADAVRLFRDALALAARLRADARAMLPTRQNLGHACRRAGLFADALAAFDHVLRAGGRDPAVLAAKGLVLLQQGNVWPAVLALHQALAISPHDPVATDLLAKALDLSSQMSVVPAPDDDLADSLLAAAVRSSSRKTLVAGTSRPPARQLPLAAGPDADLEMVVDADD